jgi:2-isopropylmalate synthase
MDNYIHIFDTTLRDGEQSPGAALNVDEKLEIAHELAEMGVDIIEAGFPISSPGDFRAVQLISQEIRSCTVCGLTRAKREDIETAAEALKGAARPRIHTGLGVSDVHIQYKLRATRETAMEMGVEAVKYAKKFVGDVQYYTEDAGRADPAYLYQVLEAVIAAGATVVNVPDTTGYTTPEEFGALIRGIMENVPNIHKAIVSVHCHNDLGMATANTLAGIRNGARQAEVTINGIGERAGNSSLEEVVMAIKTRRLHPLSRLVSQLTGIPVQPNKAIVGANAFAHSSGIHQDGVLKERATYEIINPRDVGVPDSEIILSARSGRHGLRHRLSELGYTLGDDQFEKVYQRFLDVADKKKTVDTRDLEAIVADESYQTQEVFTLDGLQVACGTMGMPTATVRLRGPDGALHTQAAVGTGPVDATYKAIDAIVQAPSTLLEFAVRAVTEGIDALGEVTVRVEGKNGSQILHAQKEVMQTRTFGGHGADTDIIVASAKAYLAALNKLLVATGQCASSEATASVGQTQTA